MSGIYGFAVRQGIADPGGVLTAMREALPAPCPATHRQWAMPEGYAGLGAVHPLRIGDPGHYAEDPLRQVVCVLDGVVYRDADAPGENPVEPNGAALLLRRYLESGIECLRTLSGSFNVAWWDGEARRLIVANDKLGHRLLFYGLRDGTLVFASLLARVMAPGVLSTEIDVEAFADLLHYEHILGERTLFTNVRILPTASVLTFEEGRSNVQPYWRLDQIEPHGRYDKRRLDELEHLFKVAVRRALRPDLKGAIGLTGGLDSRCILAAAAHQRLTCVAHTGGQPDSTDVVLARAVAARAHVPHIFEPVTAERANEWLTPMVHYQGAIIATLHCHPCQTFDWPLPFDAIVQGIGIPYMRGHWITANDLQLTDRASAQAFLNNKIMTGTPRRLDLAQLWRPEFRSAACGAPGEHLAMLLAETTISDSIPAALEVINLRERCRKFLNKAILIVRACREAYFPYLDHELIEALAAVPFSERVTHRIQVDMIRRMYPALLDIPYEKNLMPLSATPAQIEMIRVYRGVRRRLSDRLPFVRPNPAKVPNHYYSEWSQREMKPVLTDLLYRPDAAFRKYLRWEVVQRALDEHFSGKDNWGSLVASLAVFEIAHQLWVNT